MMLFFTPFFLCEKILTTGDSSPLGNEPLAKALNPEINTAVIPVPKLEHDCYLWFKRHEEVLKLQKEKNHEIVLIGDSITNFWAGAPQAPYQNGPESWQKLFGNRSVLNMGCGWDRTQNVLWRLENGQMKGQRPEYIMLNIGTNNLTATENARANSPEEITEGIALICKKLLLESPSSKILVMGVFPRGSKPTDSYRDPIKRINQLLPDVLKFSPMISFLDIGNKFLAQEGTLLADLFPDETHPSEKGYSIWAESISSFFRK